MNKKIRCSWAGNTPIYIDYHDNEWGRPVKKRFVGKGAN